MGELLVVLVICVFMFGSKRLPELASGMGKAIRNFKRGLDERDETNVTPDERQVSSTSSAQSLDASQKVHNVQANSKS